MFIFISDVLVPVGRIYALGMDRLQPPVCVCCVACWLLLRVCLWPLWAVFVLSLAGCCFVFARGRCGLCSGGLYPLYVVQYVYFEYNELLLGAKQNQSSGCFWL